MAFIKRILEARITMAQGGFAGQPVGTPSSTVLNTLDLRGLRMSAKLVNAGGAAMGECQLTIWGMTTSQMNTLSTLGMRVQQVPITNAVSLLAGDTETGLSLIFEGTIVSAYADLEAQPNVAFRMTAKSGMAHAVTALPSTSYKGSVNVSQVLAGIALAAGLAFENSSGVSVVIPNQHYFGTVRNQIKRCCDNAGIGWTIENNTLIIYPRNGSRSMPVQSISPASGLLDYPAYSAAGIRLRTIFNPALKFRAQAEVISDQVPKSMWIINKLGHTLEAEFPKGRWESDLELIAPGQSSTPT